MEKKQRLFSLFNSIKRIDLTKQQKIILGVSLVTFLVLTFFICTSIFLGNQSIKWQKAENVLPKGAWEVLHQKYPLQKATAITINAKSAKYYFLDFHNPNLCGNGGCLFILADDKGNMLVSQLLQKRLPENIDIFSMTNADDGQERNCFTITQLSEQIQTLKYQKYCRVGNTFTLINSYEKSYKATENTVKTQPSPTSK